MIDQVSPSILTDEERAILDLTAEVYNRFVALPDKQPSDNGEMATDIHRIQHRIMARAAVRAYPHYFTRTS